MENKKHQSIEYRFWQRPDSYEIIVLLLGIPTIMIAFSLGVSQWVLSYLDNFLAILFSIISLSIGAFLLEKAKGPVFILRNNEIELCNSLRRFRLGSESLTGIEIFQNRLYIEFNFAKSSIAQRITPFSISGPLMKISGWKSDFTDRNWIAKPLQIYSSHIIVFLDELDTENKDIKADLEKFLKIDVTVR